MDLLKEGIRFVRENGELVCYGPSDRPELYERLRQEIARRVEAMLAWRARQPPPRASYLKPTLQVLDSPPRHYGACWSCGESLPKNRGGDCDLCAAARQKALRQ